MNSVVLMLGLAALGGDRLVVLFDSHAAPGLSAGWGYSAYIEFRGTRLLFDAGGSAAALEGNAKALGIDLTKLDAVVISHDDPDHYEGLPYLSSLRWSGPVYVPDSDSGAFATSMTNRMLRFFEALMPGRRVVDAPAGLRYVRVGAPLQYRPWVRIVPFEFEGGRREQALLLDTPGGVAMITGCAHPGIVKMVAGAGSRVRILAGGMHLADAPAPKIREVAAALKKAGVEAAWPGHCTGTKAVEELRRKIGPRVSALAVGGSAPLGK